MQDFDFLTVQIPREVTRRLASIGFPHEMAPSEVARFLIEKGVVVLERDEPRAA